ncbi:MAG: 2OG-Fe(II) oxygenase [Bryobacterales bacterium]
MSAPEMAPATIARIASFDWKRVEDDLEAQGYAVLERLLDPAECASVAELFPSAEVFRSQVVMERYNFGRGVYKYFRYPLPPLVQTLRSELYARVAAVANGWSESMGLAERYPGRHADFVSQCHESGQTRPTPLLLEYGVDDYNCLHQDLHGDLWFPLQAAVLLSQPGRDFEGGEFVLTEQRPRMQSRPMVVPLEKETQWCSR